MNWEQHFRQMKPRSGVGFGIIPITRDHSAAELRDIIKAHEYSIAQTDKGFNALTAEQIKAAGADWVQWIQEWGMLKARFKAMRDASNQFFAEHVEDSVVPENMFPAEPLYVGIQQTVQQTYPEPHTSPGDLVDLVGRAKQMGAKLDFSNMPQPRPDSDAEFNTLRKVQDITDTIELKNLSTKTWIIIGAVVVGAVVILPRLLMPIPRL